MNVHQENPSAPSEWRLWKRACLLWNNIHGTLRQPLGKWIVAPAQQRQHQFAYALHEHLWLRQELPEQYRVYRRYEVDEGYHALQRVINIADIPVSATPTSVEQHNAADLWMLTSTSNAAFAYIQLIRPTVNTFSDFIATLRPWKLKLLQHATFESDPFDFCEDLKPHVRAVSDGSVRHETQGSFGWAIRNERGASVASGMGPARGGRRVTSYRAEA